MKNTGANAWSARAFAAPPLDPVPKVPDDYSIEIRRDPSVFL